ncbi:MAG TPA: DUF4383 domain-containing protein [Longimicrobiaceae bacterium]
MTTVQRVAQVFGIGFLLAAVAGFVAAGGSMDPHTATAPRALGLFPVNLLHNLIHLAFGVWGLAASRSWGAARTYCRAAGVTYLVLMVMGFIAPDTFGLVPIGGNDIWLHAVLGIPLAYFGFTARGAAPAGARP